MSSPIFDATFGTGRFKYEEPMTTDQSQATPSHAPSPEPQDVRVTDAMVEAAMNAYDDPGGFRKTDFECMRAALYAALAQSDAEPKHDVRVTDAMVEAAGETGLIEAAEWLGTAASRFEEAADALRSEYKTYARQMDRWAGDTRERARLFSILSRAADRSVHGKLIPDCPTDGVAARQGNGG